MRGKFIVIYGSNNIGKSEQVKLLSIEFVEKEVEFLKIKYPIYSLKPTGPEINKILRSPSRISELELQKIFAQNRRDFQPTLKKILESGINIVAEDYTGTGLAWGLTRDCTIKELEDINKDLLVPDLAILLDGERFFTKVEAGHRNEGSNQETWEKNRSVHQFLAKRYGWYIVNANQKIKEVHSDILDIVKSSTSILGK